LTDGHFLYSATINNWLNIPAWSHQNGTTFTFADGHGEYWKWQSARPTTTYFTTGSTLTDPWHFWTSRDCNRRQWAQIDCCRV